MTDEKKILYTSDEAASIQTVTGWVSRGGQFWGDNEHAARYGGATHMVCEKCGGEYLRSSWCAPCHTEKQSAAYLEYPVQEWDGVTPLAIFDSDTYFFDFAAIELYCDTYDVKLEDLRLVLCEPQHVPNFELLSHCEDVLPEDGDESCIDSAIVAAADALEKAIRESDKAVSWYPSKVAIKLTNVGDQT